MIGGNSKKNRKGGTGVAKSAKDRKLEAEAARRILEAREKEDQQWREAEGTKSRAALRREAKAERQAEALARKASARMLAKQEEKALERELKKKRNNKALMKEELQVPELRSWRSRRVASKKEYEEIIFAENKNRLVVEAGCMEEAVEIMAADGNLQICKVEAAQGNRGNCLLFYTKGEKKPLMVDFRLTV